MAKIKFKIGFVMHVDVADNPSHREKLEAVDAIRNTISSDKDISDVIVEELLDIDFTKGCSIESKQLGE